MLAQAAWGLPRRYVKLTQTGRVTILCREGKPYSRVLLPYLLVGTVEEEALFLPVSKEVEVLGGREIVKVKTFNLGLPKVY